MKSKILAIGLVILLTTVCLTSIVPFTQAATSENKWITSYKIENADTEQILLEYSAETNETENYSPVLPNTNVKITFTVNVMVSGEGNLKLTSGLGKSLTSKYWELVTEDYDLGSAYNPNSQTASFAWTVGEFEMILYGKVPAATTTRPVNAVSLYGPSGGVALDKITITPTTAEMDNFLTLLDQRQTDLGSMIGSGVDPGFTDAYANVLDIAQAVAEGGDIENAIALLNGINVSNPPAGSTMQMLFLPLIVVAFVLAGLFLFMFMRTRGKLSYITLVVEDQVKDLEGLTLRAAKVDRAMSANLDSVKDRLKRLVG